MPRLDRTGECGASIYGGAAGLSSFLSNKGSIRLRGERGGRALLFDWYRLSGRGIRSSSSRVSFELDKNCWVCPKWLKHSIVAGLPCRHSCFETRMATGQVECSIHFAHTQQLLSNGKLSLSSRLHACIRRLFVNAPQKWRYWTGTDAPNLSLFTC